MDGVQLWVLVCLLRGEAAGGIWFGFSFLVGTVPMKAVSGHQDTTSGAALALKTHSVVTLGCV